MKKILGISLLALLAVSACKKKENTVSQLVTYSTPTISISGNQLYYSINVGGALPTINATAYDSFYNESDPVSIDQSTLDNTMPGLYVVTINSQNKYAMKSSASVFVAVTDIDPAINLAGQYARTSNGVVVNVTKLANGLYMTDNVGGVDPSVPSNAPFILPAVFVQTDDTTIVLPAQETAQGTLYGTDAGIVMAPSDTAYHYVVHNAAFGTAVRTFQKL